MKSSGHSSNPPPLPLPPLNSRPSSRTRAGEKNPREKNANIESGERWRKAFRYSESFSGVIDNPMDSNGRNKEEDGEGGGGEGEGGGSSATHAAHRTRKRRRSPPRRRFTNHLGPSESRKVKESRAIIIDYCPEGGKKKFLAVSHS